VAAAPEILVTGGAGYIGSHVLVALLAAGYRCVCIDNYSNGSPAALARVREIARNPLEAYEVDIRDFDNLRSIFARHSIGSVIHMAGLKAVGESVRNPQLYHDNNVEGTRTLLAALQESPVRNFVFSSSATVYGAATKMPIDESAPLAPESPYGENKAEIERLLAACTSWRVANLRYFNPVGAHPSGLMGEDPAGTPNNLMPFVCQTASGRREELSIFGNDYPTPDGTGVRDYIHVMDLADGHLAALGALESMPEGTVEAINLGTSKGVSVLELVESFERVNRVKVKRRIAPRREGDVAICYADASRARRLLGWTATRTLEDMCRDAWKWQRRNPEGYRSASPS